MAVRPLQEVCCIVGAKKREEIDERNICVLFVEVKTWRNVKEVNYDLQLHN